MATATIATFRATTRPFGSRSHRLPKERDNMKCIVPRSLAATATFAVTKRTASGFCAFTHRGDVVRWRSGACETPSATIFGRTAFMSCRTTRNRSFQSATQSVSSSTDSDSDATGPTPATSTTEYATSYHAPVMPTECVDALLGCDRCQPADESSTAVTSVDSKPLVFVDGTLGGGGHSSAILERLGPGDILFGCDVDPSALSTASQRLRKFLVAEGWDHDPTLPIFVPVQSNFRDLLDILPEVRHPIAGAPILEPLDDEGSEDDDHPGFVGVDGMLLDLGVSSHQIDNPDRGFAFMKDGPLDMRMWNGDWSSFDAAATAAEAGGGTSYGLTAADVCNEFDVVELTRVLKKYGDEPRAKKIAAAIVRHRPLETTGDLMEAVSAVTPEFAKKGRRMGRTATLARVFQSLRIVVNEEDLALAEALEDAAPALVRPGGRLVVLSYHSMEDRATKRVMRDGSVDGPRGGSSFERDVYGNIVGDTRPWKPLGKKRKASEQEVEFNSRSRSATLRVARRVLR